MQDWQASKTVPQQTWVSIGQFTDNHSTSLELIHELRDDGVATFLFRG